MAQLKTQSLILFLITEVPGLRRLYGKHIKDYDECLPHVFMGDVTRFVHAAFTADPKGSSEALKTLEILEQAAGSPDPGVQNLILVSFCENLEPSAPGYQQLLLHFGPNLKRALATYEAD